MKTMKAYYVYYRMHSTDDVHGIQVSAYNKEDAYDRGTYELIPEKEGSVPYSSWVHSVTYNNGNYKEFNTHEGMPY